MANKVKSKEQSALGYVKPDITLVEKMTFMFDPYKKGISKITCRQCSSCHGCR